jgi:WD40 repeat protein
LIVLERDSPRFKVYRANDCDLICEVNAHKCAVLAAEFIQNHHMVATSSNDLTINFWDSNSYSLK